MIISDISVTNEVTNGNGNIMPAGSLVYINAGLNPYIADLLIDEATVYDNSDGAPTFRVHSFEFDAEDYSIKYYPKITFDYSLPNYAIRLLCPNTKNYQMVIGGKEDLIVDGNGDIVIAQNPYGSYMYNEYTFSDHSSQFGNSFFNSLTQTGDVGTIYYQFMDSKGVSYGEYSGGQRSPIYRLDLVYDITPPTVIITLSDEAPNAKDITAAINVYDGHTANDGHGDYFVIDTTAESIKIDITAQYEDMEFIPAQDNGTYIFERNGTISVIATDASGNEATVTKTINNIKKVAQTISGTLAVDATNGKFTLSVPDIDAVKASLKFDTAYTAHLLGMSEADVDPNVALPLTSGSIPGAMVSSFENGSIELEVYAKSGVPITSATLRVTDDAGNVGELVMDVNLVGITPEVTNANKTYSYGGTLDFSVPVTLPELSSDQNFAAARHGNLNIYTDGETEIRYVDLFGRDYNEIIIANIFGDSHTFAASPTTPTNGSVEVTINTNDGFTIDGNTSKKITLTENGNVDYTIDSANGLQNYSIPVTNIDKTAPVAYCTRRVNGTEALSEAGILTVTGSVTYEILGFSKKDTHLLSEETNICIFDASGEHTFRFADAAGNEGNLIVGELNTLFESMTDLSIAKYRLTFTTGGANPIPLATFDSSSTAPQLPSTNQDIIVQVQALNAIGDVIPATMSIAEPVEGIKYYETQCTLIFMQNATTTVKLATKSGSELNVAVVIDAINKTIPKGSVIYVMQTEDETAEDGTIFKKGAIKAYLVADEQDLTNVYGDGVRKESDGRYFMYFEQNGSGVFYLQNSAGNIGTVVVGAYGIDFDAPQALDESWYSSIAAQLNADPFTSGNGKDEILSTPTNNSIRLLFNFNELLGNVEVKAYIPNNNQMLEAPNTADYIKYTVSGTMLTIEFKQNCQAMIVVSDIQGNSITLWRPDDGPITVIDRNAPVITNESRQILDNKVILTYEFDKAVAQAGVTAEYSNAHIITFKKNGIVPITFADKAGNVVTSIAAITEVDDQAPIIYYALQITSQDADIIFSDEENTQVEATNGNLEIAVGAADINDAVITIINRNKPNIPMILKTPVITSDSKFTKAASVTENGIYVITAVDIYGNTHTVNVRIDFIDKEAPVISMDSNKAVEILLNSSNETELKTKLLEGVTALDNREGAMPVSVDISSIPIDTVGTHTVTYTATDSLGNTATKIRTVTVLAKERKALIINEKSIAENDIFITQSTEAEFDLSRLIGYKLYIATGYNTRAQMKYASALDGSMLALLSKGYYTVLAQNGDMDTFLVYIYSY